MKMKYQFRFIKSTWGISIELTADDIPYSQVNNATKVTEQIFLQIDLSFKIHESEKDFIVKAILRLRDEIHKKIFGQKIIIKITSIEFDETDYQSEGLYVAMLGWISKRYNISMPIVHIDFNKELRKYIFDFD
jgi:hypothetical protein